MIPDCAHCLLPTAGHATVDGHTVCHPDCGMDCYRLVTLYKHAMPCTNQACMESARYRTRREQLEESLD